MHFIRAFLITIFLCTFAASVTIISVETGNEITENDVSQKKLNSNNAATFLETTYIKQSVGKSHRFYYNTGDRVEGDAYLDSKFKQTGWREKTDAQTNITYTTPNNKKLTYVQLTVFQESDINRIHVYEGGINQTNIAIGIIANQTRYLSYNVTYYGI